jgi:hypothetical protein
VAVAVALAGASNRIGRLEISTGAIVVLYDADGRLHAVRETTARKKMIRR